jgi:hypothetical protein
VRRWQSAQLCFSAWQQVRSQPLQLIEATLADDGVGRNTIAMRRGVQSSMVSVLDFVLQMAR